MWQTLIKFGAVGGLGVFVNLSALALLRSMGSSDAIASAMAIEISIISNFILNDHWTFRDRSHSLRSLWWGRALRFQLVSSVGASIQWTVFLFLNLLWAYWGVSGDPQADQWDIYHHALNQSAWHHLITTPPRVGDWVYASQLCGVVCATAWNFFVNYYWTWRATNEVEK